MPAQTTTPPGFVCRSACGTSAPTGAKMTAASSGSGDCSVDEPAHPAPVARHSVRSIADQTGAQERCRVHVAICFGQPEHIPRIGHGVFCVTAVDLISGESCERAQVLAAACAVLTFAARVAEPRNTHAIAFVKLGHAVT